MYGRRRRRVMSTSSAREISRVLLALDDARPGDEGKRTAAANRKVPELNGIHAAII